MMPSPLPGLDPYLESPAYWRGFHNMLITFITQSLNAVLPEGFAANAEERVYVLPQERSAVPNVAIRRAVESGSRRAAAVLEPANPDGEVLVQPGEQREAFVEIRATADWERVITVIEVLSPANKAAGKGRDEYLAKQRAILTSDTSLMEIDLLLGGLDTVAALVNVPSAHGVASLHRGWRPNHFPYWLLSIRDPLPVLPVPLQADMPESALPLQECFDLAYDAGPYRRLIDYRVSPPVALSPDDTAWLSGVVTR